MRSWRLYAKKGEKLRKKALRGGRRFLLLIVHEVEDVIKRETILALCFVR